MPEPLFEPIPIAYRGLLADQHFVCAAIWPLIGLN